METTILVTGATDGIGRETAKELARRGARVIVHGRSAEKAETLAREIEAAGGKALAPAVGDLASLSSVRKLGESLISRGERLDVLINNAGVYMNEARETEDGFEMTMGVNHFAPFLLTHLLLPLLEKAPSARIVNVSSVAHNRSPAIDLDDLVHPKRPFSPYGTYAASKLANVLFTTELAKRLGGKTITVNALHPGVVSTKLLKEGFGMSGPDSFAEGAATSVHLALSPEIAAVTGKYFARSKEASVSPSGLDAEFARAFYEKSAALVGVTPLGT